MTEPITEAIKILGFSQAARACQVSPQAVRKWWRRGCLPRSEWTGETRYAEKLVHAIVEKQGSSPYTVHDMLRRPAPTRQEEHVT